MPLRLWLIFIATILARVALGVQTMSVGTVGPDLVDALDLSYAALGTLVGIYCLPATALAFPGGWLAARLGNRIMLILGLALMTAGGAIMTIGSDYPALLAGRLTAGCGTALLSVVQTKLILDLVPKALLASLMGTFIAGYAAGCALGQSLLPLFGAWRLAMGASALLSALCLLVTAVTVPGRGAAIEQRGRFVLRPGTLTPLLQMAAVWALSNAAYMTFYSFLPTFLVGRGLPLSEAGGLSSLGLYAAILPMPFAGWLLERSIGLERATVLCLASIAVLMAMLPLGVDPVAIVLASGGLIGVVAGPAFTIATRDLQADERALAMGIFYSIHYISMAVGPAVAGLTRDITGQPAMPLYIAATYMGLAFLAQAAHGLRPRNEVPQAA